MSVNRWTRARVDNALRRYKRDYFGENEKELPLTFYAYRQAIPEGERRRVLRNRLYAPFLAVLRHYASLYEAWRALGFEVEYRKPSRRAADVRGIEFGFLTPFEYSHTTASSGRIWKCRCRCGRETLVSAKNLLRGKSRSCGCWRRTVVAQRVGFRLFKNLRGQRFGRLIAVTPAGRCSNGMLWECLCDCGKTTFVPVSSLTTGMTRSCGCLRNEKSLERLNRWREEKRNAA